MDMYEKAKEEHKYMAMVERIMATIKDINAQPHQQQKWPTPAPEEEGDGHKNLTPDSPST